MKQEIMQIEGLLFIARKAPKGIEILTLGGWVIIDEPLWFVSKQEIEEYNNETERLEAPLE